MTVFNLIGLLTRAKPDTKVYDSNLKPIRSLLLTDKDDETIVVIKAYDSNS